MIDAVILMTLALLAWIGWFIGMIRPKAQFWVRFIGPVGIIWLTWYFFVAMTRSKPMLLAGGMEAGQITVAFMVGGVWALLAKPKPPKATTDGKHQGGATTA